MLIGALFKLEHLPGAPILLGVGLSIEAIIFFVSAFEPLMELPDWKRVYPQLRTPDDFKGRDKSKYQLLDKEYYRKPGGSGGGDASLPGIGEEQLTRLKESLDKLTQTANGLTDLSAATQATDGFVRNLNEASSSIGKMVDVNKNASEKIGLTLADLSENYKASSETVKASAQKAAQNIDQSLTDLSASVKSTSESLKANTEKISSGVGQTLSGLSDSVKTTADALKLQSEKSSQDMNKTLADLSASLRANAETMKANGEKISTDLGKTGLDFSKKMHASADELSASYKKLTDSLASGFQGLEKSAGKYVEGIDKLNKNLAALNAAYEIHLKGAGKVDEMVKEYAGNVGEIGKLLHTSVEETRKFNENTKEINESIQALNKIYGRMLGALNNKK